MDKPISVSWPNRDIWDANALYCGHKAILDFLHTSFRSSHRPSAAIPLEQLRQYGPYTGEQWTQTFAAYLTC